MLGMNHKYLELFYCLTTYDLVTSLLLEIPHLNIIHNFLKWLSKLYKAIMRSDIFGKSI